MTPERWLEVKDLLASALEIPVAEREAFLDRSCAGNVSLRNDVEGLLADEQQLSPQFLEHSHFVAAAATVLPEDGSSWIGRRVGPYRIVEEIGVGGMGEVYRAFRADDEYRKEVALKVVRAGQESRFVIGRFKNERQILAGLDHPNIAKLLDGGTTEEGMPYFVMELIEGKPITEYCDRHSLSITERLKLFSQVCAAVQYAHQRLIIHRDIKPGNILVTAEGTPKLLDFGIAKILDFDPASSAPEATLTAFRALTPRYASPEQIKGEPMTTGSDVYSLGMVLYELLTGRDPYRLATGTPQEIARAACDSEPQKPSVAASRVESGSDHASQPANRSDSSSVRDSSPEKLRRRLSGDLDNIVLMALRKEPSRRYASVEQLAADIRRHLEDLPVVARTDTVGYRASKFASRHKAAVIASAAAVLALLGGLAIALHEARIARMQAEIARVQRSRAERRFNDVRKLANSLMFEVHDSIKDLPGTTSARKLLVGRALEYLDSLSQEASGDASLQRELAAAYDRVGDLLGYNGAANLGDYAGALQSYDKALAIREASAAANPDDVQIQSELLADYFRLSFVLQDSGDYAGALRDLRKALPMLKKNAVTHVDPKYQDYLAGFYWQTGNVLNQTGDYTGALESFRQAASIREPIARGANASPLFRGHLAADYAGMGKTLLRTGEDNQALEVLKRGLQITEQLCRDNPTNATLREYLGEGYSWLPVALEKQGNFAQALEYNRRAHQIFGGLMSSDPTNALARVNFGLTDLAIGEELTHKGEIQQALTHIRKAIALFEGMEDKNRYVAVGQAQSYSALAMVYVSMADKDTSPLDKRGHLRQARSWYEKSLSTWQKDPYDRSVNPLGGDETKDQVAQDLAKCDAALVKLQAHVGLPPAR